MDIERLNLIGSTLDTRLKRKKDDEKTKSTKLGKTSFSGSLDKASSDTASSAGIHLSSMPSLDGTESLEDLLDDVHETGEALKKDPVFGPLSEYKDSVRRFLRYILENGMELGQVTGVRNPKTMQQKKYVIIRIIDDRLESLAAHVLKGQADQLEILRRVDEIHGMLVDLTG